MVVTTSSPDGRGFIQVVFWERRGGSTGFVGAGLLLCQEQGLEGFMCGRRLLVFILSLIGDDAIKGGLQMVNPKVAFGMHLGG